MKIVEKISLIIFAYLLLIISIIACLLVFNWVSLQFVHEVVIAALNNTTVSNIILGVSAVIILLAIKCIFFSGSDKEKDRQKDGILLENDEGKLLISKETLENLISSVAKGFEGAENVNTKVALDKENNLVVYINLLVHPDAVIKDLSSNLQTKVKEAIKTTSGLDVKEVNIRVKNIAPEKSNIEE
ncbi:MAG: alkaline shock response membrane anchor protein AmaP [Clostridia bacterium]|nr:alkaline shock response membrane anchor protein AmaP [Clostridia bacterium]